MHLPQPEVGSQRGMAGEPLFARLRFRDGCRCRSPRCRSTVRAPVLQASAWDRWGCIPMTPSTCPNETRRWPGIPFPRPGIAGAGGDPPIGALLATRKCRAGAGSDTREFRCSRRGDCRPDLSAGDSGQDRTAPRLRCGRGHEQRRFMVALPAAWALVPHRGRGACRVPK